MKRYILWYFFYFYIFDDVVPMHLRPHRLHFSMHVQRWRSGGGEGGAEKNANGGAAGALGPNKRYGLGIDKL